MGFFQRVKHDYLVIKETLKTKVVRHYIIFWLSVGIAPGFPGIDYF